MSSTHPDSQDCTPAEPLIQRPAVPREAPGLSVPYLQRVIESSPDIICTVDRFGIVLDANSAAENILGWPASQVAGESIYRFFSAERVESVKTHFARALAGET